MKSSSRFGVVDYLVFCSVLLVSAITGVYHAIRRRKEQTTEEYLSASRNLRTIPVAGSILATSFSAITLLGNTAEIYIYGTLYVTNILGESLGMLTAAWLIVPLLHKLKLTSVNEYLNLRFRFKPLVCLATSINLLDNVFYFGLAVFAAASTLESVTGVAWSVFVVIITPLTIIYSSIGGLRGVVWADLFQGVFMLVGIIVIVIVGTLHVGGIHQIWNINKNKGRLIWFDFQPSPSKRFTTWSLVIGRFFAGLQETGFSQYSFQRYSATPTIKSAQTAVYLFIALFSVTYLSIYLTGMIIFAYYSSQDCDPIKGDISSENQLLPYFITDVLNYPGFPGLFISVMCAASLSTVSSILNTLCSLTWQDFLSDVVKVNEASKVNITRSLVVVYGLVGLGTTFLFGYAQGHILWIAITLSSAIFGPLLGLFLLGLLFKRSNYKGAFIGCVVSAVTHICLSTGSLFYANKGGELPRSSNSCSEVNTTSHLNGTLLPDVWNYTLAEGNGTLIKEEDEVQNAFLVAIYAVSPVWYPLTGSLLCVMVGYIISCMTVVPEQTLEGLVLNIRDSLKGVVQLCFRKQCTSKRDQREEFHALEARGKNIT